MLGFSYHELWHNILLHNKISNKNKALQLEL